MTVLCGREKKPTIPPRKLRTVINVVLSRFLIDTRTVTYKEKFYDAKHQLLVLFYE